MSSEQMRAGPWPRLAARAPVRENSNPIFSVLLAQLLGRSDSSAGIPEFSAPFNSDQRQTLEKKLGGHFAELLSLAQERDPEMFAASLLLLGIRLELDDRLDTAGQIYGVLAGEATKVPALRAKAQQRLDNLQGRGSFGMRSEFLLRRLAKDSSDPSAILAMGVASAAFRLLRLASLSRLATSPGANFFTRGIGLKATASLVAFGGETLSFTTSAKLGATALGEKQDWSPQAFAREWATGAMMLGGLKAVGGLSHSAVQRWAGGNSALERLTQTVVPVAGQFSGILLGNRLQESVGLRNATARSTEWADALASLVHFQVGGKLASMTFGPGIASLERRADLQAERLTEPQPPTAFSNSMHWSFAGLDPRAVIASGREESQSPPLVMMSGGFTAIHQLESRLSKGHIILDIGTRQTEPTMSHSHWVYTLEDAFTSLLLNFHTQETKHLKGPLVALLRQDASLRKFFAEYGSEPNKTLWALIDSETGNLQRMIAFDEQRRPRSMLLWDEGSSPAVNLNFGQHRPELPLVAARLLAWDAAAERLRELPEPPEARYNGIAWSKAMEPENVAQLEAASQLKVQILPETYREMHYELDRSAPAQWRLSDAEGRLIFSVKPESRGHWFEYNHFARAIPETVVSKPVPKPVAAPVSKRSSENTKRATDTKKAPAAKEPAPPAPGPAFEPNPILPAVESVKLQAARAALEALRAPAMESAANAKRAIAKLKAEIRGLSDSEMGSLVGGIEAQLRFFFSSGDMGYEFLQKALLKLPSGFRLQLARKIAEYLGDEHPPRRVAAFDILRPVISDMSGAELSAFEQMLSQLFPKGQWDSARRAMIDQARYRIQEARSKQDGGGGKPPIGTLAALIGLGTLLQSSPADAAELLNIFLPHHGLHGAEPNMMTAALFGGVVTTVLSRKVVRRLTQKVGGLADVIWNRFRRADRPSELFRDRAHPYRLVLADFPALMRRGAETVIAKREGGEIRMQTKLVLEEENPPLGLESGTHRMIVVLKESEDDRGGATLFLDRDTLHLYQIGTERMRPGVGTIFLDWLATQAARQNRAFSIRDINNPKIFRILNRIPLFDPETVQVGGTYWPPLTQNPLDFEGNIDDPFLQASHERAKFQVFGQPHPDLLPPELRPKDI